MADAVGLASPGPLARPRRQLAAVLSCASALVSGCRGEHLVLTSDDGVEVGTGADAGGETEDPRVDNTSGSGPAFASACPTEPALRRERIDCWPTRYLGLWSGFFVGAPQYEARDGSLQSFPIGGLELRLSVDGSGSLSFGDSAPPAPPSGAADPYLCAGATPSSGCAAARGVVEGFAYTLEDLAIFDASMESAAHIGEEPIVIGERLRFGVSLGEPWRAWCGEQVAEAASCRCAECGSEICFELGLAPTMSEAACETSAAQAECGWLAARAEEPCTCRSDGCFARERALDLLLQMSEDGQALRGEYLPIRGDLRPGRVEFSRIE